MVALAQEMGLQRAQPFSTSTTTTTTTKQKTPSHTSSQPATSRRPTSDGSWKMAADEGGRGGRGVPGGKAVGEVAGTGAQGWWWGARFVRLVERGWGAGARTAAGGEGGEGSSSEGSTSTSTSTSPCSAAAADVSAAKRQTVTAAGGGKGDEEGDDGGGMAIWDGSQFVVNVTGAGGWAGGWETMKLALRYGPAPLVYSKHVMKVREAVRCAVQYSAVQQYEKYGAIAHGAVQCG
jgi:hypothetical protein